MAQTDPEIWDDKRRLGLAQKITEYLNQHSQEGECWYLAYEMIEKLNRLLDAIPQEEDSSIDNIFQFLKRNSYVQVATRNFTQTIVKEWFETGNIQSDRLAELVKFMDGYVNISILKMIDDWFFKFGTPRTAESVIQALAMNDEKEVKYYKKRLLMKFSELFEWLNK